MTGDHIIYEVSIKAAPVAASLGYHAIGAPACGVSVTGVTSAARAGYFSCNSRVWSIHGREYSPWL